VDNDLLLAAIDAAEQSSYSSEGDTQLSTDRAYAIDMYLGKNLEPAPEGRSQVIDRSVFETIQWILPSLCRIFANGDDVVELPPVGPEDEGSFSRTIGSRRSSPGRPMRCSRRTRIALPTARSART
jgi:hypothetical protein